MRGRSLRAALPILVSLAATRLPGASEQFPRGEIVPRVVCSGNGQQSYALYLPAASASGKPLPILYVLDPRKRGVLAAERFQEAAERYGYILASSNNTMSDGPLAPTLEAIRAIWTDTHERFAIDPQRVYLVGFSGTARAACLLAGTSGGQIAGVIGCGAGFPDATTAKKDLPFLFFGAVGNTDFNYREMRDLDRTLAGLGVTRRLAVFDGPHGWPPVPVCTRAVEWMELRTMQKGARPRDDAFASRVLEREMADAAAREAAGKLGEALDRYREIAADFDGLADVSPARAAGDRLASDPRSAKQKKQQESLEQREDVQRAELAAKLMEDLRSDDPLPPLRVSADLKLTALKRRAESDPDEAQRLSAKRLLAALSVQTSFYLPREYLEHRDARRARLCAAVAAEISPERAGLVWYNFACLQAQAGDKKSAVATLREAVEKGFHDANLMESDPDLDALRDDAGYRKILEGLKGAAR